VTDVHFLSLQPRIACFSNDFDQQLFTLSAHGFFTELPSKAGGYSNASNPDLAYPLVKHDLRRQISNQRVQAELVATACKERMGDVLSFMGSEFFSYDTDYISKLVEGEKTPINCTSVWISEYDSIADDGAFISLGYIRRHGNWADHGEGAPAWPSRQNRPGRCDQPC
jgi:hypothetical protein